ncbi:hypothetical protein F5Y16DRAFT_374810 [Xylariaceae sp. FL0255]|nr:hypothetical protein F5Y16DRAFT_374810 [Xylariaceae sp. FL0255]
MRVVAQVTLDLLKMQESRGSALSWVKSKISRIRTQRAMTGDLPGLSVKNCVELSNLVSRFHFPACDDAPHVLMYGNISPSNIIMMGEEVQW